LPDWKSPWPEPPSLVRLPVPGSRSFARRIGLIWPRASLRLRLVRAFLEQAKVASGRGAATRSARLGAITRK
jgi:hypothetical protein